jgi:hypothetical protein
MNEFDAGAFRNAYRYLLYTLGDTAQFSHIEAKNKKWARNPLDT